MTDPGVYLAGTAVSLTATGTDGGSGVANVKIQRSPAGAGTWTDVCTDTSSPLRLHVRLDRGHRRPLRLPRDHDRQRGQHDDVLHGDEPARRQHGPHRRPDRSGRVSPRDGHLERNEHGRWLGVLNVKIQRAPTGTGVDICTDATSPYSCSWDTTSWPNGGYDLRAVATDNAGNVTYSTTLVNRVVDNTAPTASDVQTTNVGGRHPGPAGERRHGHLHLQRADPDDVDPGRLERTATAVTVRINNQGGNDRLEVWDAANTAKLPLTSTFLGLNNNYVTGDSTFNGTMVQAGRASRSRSAP